MSGWGQYCADFVYYGVTTDIEALHEFRQEITQRRRRSLLRRSQRRRLNWARLIRLVDQWLPVWTGIQNRPAARRVHPWPEARFAVRTRDKSPVRQLRTLGSVRGRLKSSDEEPSLPRSTIPYGHFAASFQNAWQLRSTNVQAGGPPSARIRHLWCANLFNWLRRAR
jgi:hypothetical protein